MSALVGVWFCWCTTAADMRAEIAETCDHHGARLIAEPEEVDRDGPVRLGHDCSLGDLAIDTPPDRPALTVIRGAA